MNRTPSLFALLLVVIGVVVAACSTAGTPTPSTGTPPPGASPSPAPTGPAASPSPTSSPATSPAPTTGGQVTSAAQAAALVLAAEPRFARMTAQQPDLIGQSAWYEAFEAGNGFSVAVTLGSGDCFAGCIDRHTWTYHVAFDGTITLVGETGDEVEVSIPDGSAEPMTVSVLLLAGPVCPVEQIPPDPNCAPRPIVNAEVVLRDPSGAEVSRDLSDAEGRVIFAVPGGAYYVAAGPVEGLMQSTAEQAFSGVGGDEVGIRLGFDTGIR